MPQIVVIEPRVRRLSARRPAGEICEHPPVAGEHYTFQAE
jgi:hypothetical protein